MSEEQQIEVAEQSPAPAAVQEKPTRDEVIKERGWSKDEADKAEKFGMLRTEEKPKEPKEPVKADAVKPEAAAPVVPARREEDRKRGGNPELNLTAEQEAKLREIVPGGVSGILSEVKRERALKQRWRTEAEQFKARLEVLEKGAAKPAVTVEGDAPDEDAPLTLRQIKAMQDKAAEDYRKAQEETQTRGNRLSEAQKTHEELARATYDDFEDVAKLATDLVQNLDKYAPAGKQRAKVLKAYTDFMAAAKNADGIDPENDLTEADLAYELGKLHPNFGKNASDGSKADDGTQPEISPTDGTGDHTPDRLKKLEAITQRRASSASIPGGNGRRTVSPSEVTLDHLNRMTREQRASFKEKYPDRHNKLLRG